MTKDQQLDAAVAEFIAQAATALNDTGLAMTTKSNAGEKIRWVAWAYHVDGFPNAELTCAAGYVKLQLHLSQDGKLERTVELSRCHFQNP